MLNVTMNRPAISFQSRVSVAQELLTTGSYALGKKVIGDIKAGAGNTSQVESCKKLLNNPECVRIVKELGEKLKATVNADDLFPKTFGKEEKIRFNPETLQEGFSLIKKALQGTKDEVWKNFYKEIEKVKRAGDIEFLKKLENIFSNSSKTSKFKPVKIKGKKRNSEVVVIRKKTKKPNPLKKIA